jgi:transaldolase
LALKGKAAVANAKEAYRLFRETFSARAGRRSPQGRQLQRPLWASTSTKNPDYSDILYVQELIGPDTVNTMPLNTIAAYRDHGAPAETVDKGQAEARTHLERLNSLGISMAEVTAQLEEEGVKAFVDSHEALLAALGEKRRALMPESS